MLNNGIEQSFIANNIFRFNAVKKGLDGFKLTCSTQLVYDSRVGGVFVPVASFFCSRKDLEGAVGILDILEFVEQKNGLANGTCDFWLAFSVGFF